MDLRLLEVIACPVCKGKLEYSKSKNELRCKFDKIAFPIHDGVPVLKEEEAREIGDK